MSVQHILAAARQAADRTVALRRDLHQYPELAYTEYRTASLIARRLADLGFSVSVGRSVMNAASRFGLPSAQELARHEERARGEGADPDYLAELAGGFTAVVGTLRGARPGPTVAVRMDMDALPIAEAEGEAHRPASEGFLSRHPGVMHACGHDGHTAIGVGLAETLVRIRDELAGTVNLIFQPGEEGGKGALPMVRAGVVDDVDYFLAFHLGMDAPSGTIYPRVEGFLASSKLDVTFRGAAAHAGARPEEGRNALLGAAQAVAGLYAISRHRAGVSRINVGVLRAGTGRNIIPDHAYLMLETRGETAEIDAYMQRRARAVLEGAALAHDLEVEIVPVGSTTTATGDAALAEVVAAAAASVPGLRVVHEPLPAGGSEDATFFMRRVQERRGLALYLGIGTDLPSGHHTPTFDIQEKDLFGGIATLAITVARLTSGGLP